MGLKSDYKHTEVGTIPVDWHVSTVGDEFSIQLGKMLDSEKNIGIPKRYLGNRAIQWGRIDLDGLGVVKMTPSDLRRFRLRNGDLLVCEGGEIGRAAIWKDLIPECYYQKALHRLRPIRGYNVFLMLCMLERWALTGFLTNFVTQTSIAHLPKDKLEKIPLPIPPTKAEQDAIAKVLGDANALIESLMQLIAKKRNLKRGAVQELLRPKDGWIPQNLGNIADPNQRWSFTGGPFGSNLKASDYTLEGVRIIQLQNIGDGEFKNDYEAFTSYEKANELLSCNIYPGEILLSKMGDPVARACITPSLRERYLMCSDGIRLAVDKRRFNPYFVYTAINAPAFRKKAEDAGSGSTRKRIGLNALRNLELFCPKLEEQTAIAVILADLDAEIAGLEARLVKTRLLKQGMMNSLLTGKIRLVASAIAELKPSAPTSENNVVTPARGESHTWAFNEAVIISVLADQFGKQEFPLGRKRRTKLSYLFHRKTDQEVEGYLKKAAGPYNPKTKYAGPEKIAQENGYVQNHQSGKFNGFIAAEKIAQAKTYFAKWYDPKITAWLEQFRFKSNDELECLATVDMAMQEILKQQKTADVDSVRALIASEPDWLPKLDRSAFSDLRIAEAIAQCHALFG
jgi:type I restriction enzyme, S subunit